MAIHAAMDVDNIRRLPCRGRGLRRFDAAGKGEEGLEICLDLPYYILCHRRG